MTRFWKAILVLEITSKFSVITVVSDDASPNRKFYSMHAPLDELNTQDGKYRTINLIEPMCNIRFLQMLHIFLKQLEIANIVLVMAVVQVLCGR